MGRTLSKKVFKKIFYLETWIIYDILLFNKLQKKKVGLTYLWSTIMKVVLRTRKQYV